MKFSTIIILSTALFSVCVYVTGMFMFGKKKDKTKKTPKLDVIAEPSSSNVEYNKDGSIADDVELSISCENLLGKDLLSKSDPMCITLMKSPESPNYKEYHRTRAIKNNHNPSFIEKPVIKYKFEEVQYLRFEIYDEDSSSENLENHDFLGYIECHLGDIMHKKRKDFNLKIKNAGGEDQDIESKIFITAETLRQVNTEVVMQLSAKKLVKKGIFTSDPFLVIHKVTESNQLIPVYKTEVKKFIRKSTKWERIHISVQKLCNGDYQRRLRFICYDHNNNGDHKLIGEFDTTLLDLSKNKGAIFILKNPAKEEPNCVKSGEIHLEDIQFEFSNDDQFIDYIMGGLQIHCTIAIDFTESNGIATHPSSLHYISEGLFNHYETAIRSVVAIIEDYDSDKRFPVLGYGGRLPPDYNISYEFHVNGQTNPLCDGVDGVCKAYRDCIRKVKLSGPTYFSPVIEHIIKQAGGLKSGEDYFILLILTDGKIHDMDETTKSIIKAAELPISIIIVGIGDADFSSMDKLDGDTVCLQSGQQCAKRDIVQFVPYNKIIFAGDPSTSGVRLAREVLYEVPRQVVSFMKEHEFKPKQRVL